MSYNKSKNVSDNLHDYFEKAILDQVYKPGDRLPAERELCEKKGYARATVRAAYRSLQEKGLIRIRRGGGAYVQEVDSSLVADGLATLIKYRKVSLRHFFEFRDAFEARCVACAVERATQEQIDALRAHIDDLAEFLKTHGKTLEFYQKELALHTDIAKMTGNPMFEWIALTHQHSIESFNEYIDGIFLAKDEPLEDVIGDWRLLANAIENREAGWAVAVMESHVFRFRKIIQGLSENESGLVPENQKNSINSRGK